MANIPKVTIATTRTNSGSSPSGDVKPRAKASGFVRSGAASQLEANPAPKASGNSRAKNPPPSMTTDIAGRNQTAINGSLGANEMMLKHIEDAAMQQMQFQTANATIQSITKMSEAVAKQIKNVGEGIKSTGAQ